MACSLFLIEFGVFYCHGFGCAPAGFSSAGVIPLSRVMESQNSAQPHAKFELPPKNR